MTGESPRCWASRARRPRAITIAAGIELMQHRIRKGQFGLGRLRITKVDSRLQCGMRAQA